MKSEETGQMREIQSTRLSNSDIPIADPLARVVPKLQIENPVCNLNIAELFRAARKDRR